MTVVDVVTVEMTSVEQWNQSEYSDASDELVVYQANFSVLTAPTQHNTHRLGSPSTRHRISWCQW